MQHDIPWPLLEKYFVHETDPLETQQVKEWIGSAAENVMIAEQLHHYYQTTGSLPLEFTPDTAAALKKVAIATPKKTKTLRLPSIWWKVAAVLLIGFSSWWFVHEQPNRQAPAAMAVLKAQADGLNIILSDGSHIWLNAHSSIRYPKKFAHTRDIYLDGEAYFEIAHDANHPFVVHSAKTQTRVLGTKFNVRSYPSERQIEVTVAEGKVGFGCATNNQVLLTPNQKGTFDKRTGQVVETENDNSNFIAWKTREFTFDGQPLTKVFGTLAEVYHFRYQFDSPTLKRRMLTANFKNRPLTEIIQTIALSANVEVTCQNGIYFIK